MNPQLYMLLSVGVAALRVILVRRSNSQNEDKQNGNRQNIFPILSNYSMLSHAIE